MSNQDRFYALTAVAADLHMHLGDQRAGGVEYFQSASFSLILYCPGNPVCAKNNSAVIGYLVELVDEDCPFLIQVVDHVSVVYHFVAYVDGRTKHFNCTFYDFDGAVNAGTKSAGIGE